MSMGTPVISAENLCVSANAKDILKQVSFSADKGEIFALLGGNGAGKSTTLKTFLGLMSPQSGSAKLLGKSVHANPQLVREAVAYLPESVMLYGHLSAVENIRYFLSLANAIHTDEAIHAALERVSLQSAAWHTELGRFSKGMRQKTAIALAMLRQTSILLLDEPTSGLDPVAIDEFNALVSELAQQGATILMVTHDVYGACQVANKISLLRHGEIVGNFASTTAGAIETQVVHDAFAHKASS